MPGDVRAQARRRRVFTWVLCPTVSVRGGRIVNRILSYMRETMKTGFATVDDAATSIQQYTSNRTVRRAWTASEAS